MDTLFIKTFIQSALALLFLLLMTPVDGASLSCASKEPQETIIEAKETLRKDPWNADAHACLALAYDRSGHGYRAIKKMRDAEEQLPQHILGAIHDLLWDVSPELLARKEFTDRYTMTGGDCIIKNTSMIDGFGYLILGRYYNPDTQTAMRHLGAIKCDRAMDKCRDRNLACPNCTIVTPEVVLKVRAYRVEEIYPIKNAPTERNLRYINTLLRLQGDLYAR